MKNNGSKQRATAPIPQEPQAPSRRRPDPQTQPEVLGMPMSDDFRVDPTKNPYARKPIGPKALVAGYRHNSKPPKG